MNGLLAPLAVRGELVYPGAQIVDMVSYQAPGRAYALWIFRSITIQQVLARLERVKYDDIDHEMGVFGNPAYCVERIQALQRDYQMDEFIAYFNQGGIRDHAMVRQSMTLFATEVMPHCR